VQQVIEDRRTTHASASSPTSAPLFLVGPARSGTSLLYKVLCLHADAAFVSNWVARFPSVERLAVLNRLAGTFGKTRRRVWFGEESSNAYVYGRRRRVGERLFPMPVEGEPVYAAAGIPEFAAQFTDLSGEPLERCARELRSAAERIRRASGGTVFINKRIANNRRIPLLCKVFPNARFVALVRDGRAVSLSLSRVDWWEDGYVWWYGGTPRQWAAEGCDPWELCARNWVEELAAIEEGLVSVPPDRVLRLTYETFVDDPHDSLEKIARFAGLRNSASWRRAVDEIGFPNRNEAWRSALDERAIRTITDVQAETLEAHGYAI
jgi:sulfotransferase family protein